MTPWVKRLLVANVVVFFLTQVSPQLMQLLAFVPVWQLIVFRPWTIVTYMFTHAGFVHILFNMIVLFIFGPRLEARLGSQKFIWLYMLSGLGGAAFSFIPPLAPIVGASAATYGVLLGYAMFWPRHQIWIWGVLPIEARWLVVGLTAMALFFGLGRVPGDRTAHFAHLGGFAVAFLYLKWIEARSPARQFKKKVYGHVPQSPAQEASAVQRWKTIRREDLHELNRDEVERLMEKIERWGPSSLTLDEKAFLDRCAAK